MRPNDGERGTDTPLESTDPAILAFLAEASPASTVYIDTEERYRFVNRAYRHRQVRHTHVLGRTLHEVLGDHFYAQVRPHAQRALAGERVVFDVPAPQPDGSVRVFENTLVPHVVDGRVRGFLSHSIDVTERQQKVDTTAKDVEFLRAIADGVPGPIAYADRDVRYRYVNRWYAEWEDPARMLGRTAEEILGPDAYAGMRPYVERALAGEKVSYQYQLSFPNVAEPRELAITYMPHVVDGKVQGLVAFGTDLTEINQKTRALAASEARFRALFEGSALGMALVDEAGLFVSSNVAFARMLGRCPHEIEGRSILDLTPPDDREDWLDLGRSTVAGATQVVSVERRFLRRDGDCVWAHAVVSRIVDASSGTPLLVAVVEDVTEKRRLLADLKKAKESFEALAENLPVGVVVIRDYRRLFVNRAYCSVLQITREYALATDARDDVPNWESSRLRAAHDRLVRGEETTVSLVETYPTGTGGTVELALSASIIQMPDGPAQLWVGRDVTRERQLQTQLLQSQKLQAIGALAGGVAHDFNNLLTSLNAHVETLRSPQTRPVAASEALDDIERLHRRAAGLTQKLLAFARRQVIHLEPVDLNLAVKRFAAIAVRVLGEHVTVETDLDPALPTILGDATQLDQVLLNLALNARDAMPGGGQLLLATRALPPSTPGEPGEAELAVHDCGTGIPAALLPRIFEPFVTTKPVGQGAGLGLAVVHGIVEQHQGVLAVESREGAGTSVRIAFPGCAEAPANEAAAPVAEAHPSYATVLLAEDDPDLRFLVQRMLEKAGYHVWPAADGEEASRLFAARPDEVTVGVFDVVMPRLGGLEACQAIRRQRPDLPVLFVSGYSQDLVDHGVALDARTAFHPKPFTSEQLLATIGALLGRAAAARR